MNPPQITTIIPTFRRPQLLKRALESVLNQTHRNFQLIICDNASGDETAQIVASYSDNRIQYHCHKTNIGMIKNYKFGLSLVNTDYYSFLSDDDILLPCFLEEALNLYGKAPDAGFVAMSTIIMTEQGKIIRVPLDHWGREGKFMPPEGALEMIGKYPVPTSVLFNRKVALSTPIDQENPLYWDCEYLLDIASKSPIIISKRPCAIFLQHSSSFSNKQCLTNIETALHKLNSYVHHNCKLAEIDQTRANKLISEEIFKIHKAHYVTSIIEKRFNDSLNILKQMSQFEVFKENEFIYKTVYKLCKFMPVLIYGLRIIRKTKHLIAKAKSSKYKPYASNL